MIKSCLVLGKDSFHLNVYAHSDFIPTYMYSFSSITFWVLYTNVES